MMISGPDLQFGFCLLLAASTLVLIWEVFNLHFDALWDGSRMLRLAASALLFAVLCSFCGLTAFEHRPEVDWPKVLSTISLASLIHWVRHMSSRK